MKRLVYFSPVPLNSPAQRPHHFVSWFHERFDADVLWVEPYPTRLLRLQDLYRLRLPKSNLKLGPAWIDDRWVNALEVQVWPFEPLALGRTLNYRGYRAGLSQLKSWFSPDTLVVVAKPSELACRAVDDAYDGCLLYDVMDHMHLFSRGKSSAWIKQMHQHLVQRADVCWASSKALLAAIHSLGKAKVVLVPNAATLPKGTTRFETTENKSGERPSQLVFGYVGSIAPWLDWDRIKDLACALPAARVELVGPVHTKIPTLPGNVVIKPPVPQHQVYDVMSGFDVGLIPFQLNKLTDGVDPVKYYEYRASNIPVLSTRFGDMKDRSENDGVWFFESVELKSIPESLTDWKVALKEAKLFTQQNYWHHRFDGAIQTVTGLNRITDGK